MSKIQLIANGGIDKLVAWRMNEIDWIMNVGPRDEDEQALEDITKVVQMIGRAAFKSEQPEIVRALTRILEREVYDQIDRIAANNGVDILNIPENPSCSPWTPSAYFEGVTNDKW